MIKTWAKDETPKCPVDNKRELWAVISRKTDNEPALKGQNTPIWYCPDHGTQYIRVVKGD
jgi:hypothetical protein